MYLYICFVLHYTGRLLLSTTVVQRIRVIEAVLCLAHYDRRGKNHICLCMVSVPLLLLASIRYHAPVDYILLCQCAILG